MPCCQLIFRVCAIGDNWKLADSEKAVHNHLPSECHFDNTLAGLASMDRPYKAGWHQCLVKKVEVRPPTAREPKAASEVGEKSNGTPSGFTYLLRRKLNIRNCAKHNGATSSHFSEKREKANRHRSQIAAGQLSPQLCGCLGH